MIEPPGCGVTAEVLGYPAKAARADSPRLCPGGTLPSQSFQVGILPAADRTDLDPDQSDSSSDSDAWKVGAKRTPRLSSAGATQPCTDRLRLVSGRPSSG